MIKVPSLYYTRWWRMKSLESMILQFEKDFFDVDFCCSKINLENRLSVNFYEYGKSGVIYDRDRTIYMLSTMRNNKNITIDNFSATLLDENVIIAHYLSQDIDSGQYALRTSIWKKEDDLWKMFFHQGTPCSYPK